MNRNLAVLILIACVYGCGGKDVSGGNGGNGTGNGDNKTPLDGDSDVLTPDTTAPDITQVTASSHTSVFVQFSEGLASDSVAAENFTIQGEGGAIVVNSAALQSDGMSVDLSVAAGMLHGHTYTLMVQNVTDLASNAMGSVQRTFVGRGLVAAQLSGAPASITNLTTASITVSGDDVVAYQFALTGPSIAPSFGAETQVATSIELSGLVDGPYTLQVVGKDSMGNWQAYTEPTQAQWLVDTQAPTVVIESGPASPTGQRHADFTLGGAGVVAFAFELDGQERSDEMTGNALNLPLLPSGDHVLAVFGRDAAGNWQPSSAPTTYAWTIDYSLPIAELSGLPSDPTQQTSTSIAVGGAGVVAYRFSHNGGAYGEPVLADDAIALADLQDGEHTLDVLARDIYDGWQPEESPTSFTWYVDTQAPTAVLSNVPSPLTSQTTAAITVGGDGVYLYMFALDGGSYSAPLSKEDPLQLEGLSEGTHFLEVLATDRAGNWQELPTNLSWDVDFSAPTATLVNVPLAYSNQDSASITVFGADIEAYVFALDGEAFGAEQDVAQTIDLASLAEGLHTLWVLGRDAANNWQTEENVTVFAWTVDLTPPEAVVVNGPVNPTNLTHATFDFGGTDVEAYSYKLDAGAWSEEADISTAVAFTELTEGAHTLYVVGRDLAGNWQKDDAATTYVWSIDLSPPVASLTGLPTSPTNDTSLAVSAASAGVVAYRYSLDGASFGDETASSVLIEAQNLGEGAHTLQVIAKDASGNWQSESTPTTYNWNIDVTPPSGSWSSLPASPTNQTTAAIVVMGAEVAQYRYQLDGAAWTGRFNVAQVLSLSGLAEGTHTLLVVAIDLAGNEATATPLSHTWTVDLTAPVASVTFVTPAATPTNSTTFEIVTAGADVVAYRWRLDGGVWSAEIDLASNITGAVAEGSHTLDVVGKDTAGNWQALASATSLTWTVDVTAPVATLGNLPALLTNVVSTDIDVAGADVVAYRYSLNGGAYSAETDVATPLELLGLSAGTHTLEVLGKDAVGNWQAVVDATLFSWEIDLTAPTAQLNGLPAAITRFDNASITVSGSDIVAYSYSLDSGSWSGFVGIGSALTLSGLSEGSHTLRVVGRDAASNVQAQGSATSYTWMVDLTAPTVSLGSLPTSPTSVASANITVSGAGVVAYQYRLDGGSYSAEIAVAQAIALTSLSEGSHALDVVGRDQAGNWQSTPTSFAWTVDQTAPTAPGVDDLAGSIGNAGVYDNELLLTFSWSNPGDVTAVAIQVATDAAFTSIVYGAASGASVGLVQSYNYVVTASNGPRYYARVRVSDAAGNWSGFGASSNGIDVVGSVSGKVKDSNLNNVSAAAVQLQRAVDSSVIASTTTNASGDFTFANAPIGESIYRLVVSKTGFSNANKNNVSVSVATNTDVGVIYIVSSSASVGAISGRVVNANDGANINNATVTVRDWADAVVVTVTSNSSGNFATGTPKLSPGTYSLIISKTGYFNLEVNNVVVDGDRNIERQALCEILEEPHVRTVLLWGATPADLDLHVVGPSTVALADAPANRFHVYWDKRKSFNNNTGTYATASDPNGASSTTSLVQDDTSSYGPEAINLFGVGSGYAYGVYTFSVHKWSNGGTWYDAPVTLRLYDSQGMVREMPIANGAGSLRYWQAFKLDIQGTSRSQRTLTVVNTFATLTHNSKTSMNW